MEKNYKKSTMQMAMQTHMQKMPTPACLEMLEMKLDRKAANEV